MKKVFIGILVLLTFFLLGKWKMQTDLRNVNRLDLLHGERFRNGDTLLPDYTIKDTLIVVQGDSLTKYYKAVMAVMPDYPGDAAVRAVFYRWCRKL